MNIAKMVLKKKCKNKQEDSGRTRDIRMESIYKKYNMRVVDNCMVKYYMCKDKSDCKEKQRCRDTSIIYTPADCENHTMCAFEYKQSQSYMYLKQRNQSH